MPLRMYGQYIIQDDTPGESPVMVGSLWYDRLNSQLKVCTAVAPYTFTDIAGGVGTVTSVAMTVPTGLTVAGSPITGAGTLAVSLQAGYMIPGGGSAGQVLQSQGASAPAFSTATYPGTAGSANTYLRADGTNWVASALLLPNAAVQGGVAYSTATALAFSAVGVSGQVLTSQGTGAPIWTTPTVGTVTSVAMTVPSLLSVSGSPITSSGTLAVTWNAPADRVPYFSALNTLATSSGLTFTGDRLTVTDTTGEQFRVAYDGSDYLSFEVQSGGASRITTAGFGTLTVDTLILAVTGTLLPLEASQAAGSAGTFWRSTGGQWATSTLVLPNTASAGNILVASGANTYASTAPAALTRTDDTNVTLTLGGSASTALVNAASLTLGWTGQLALTRGGTAANLTAVNGGIVYSTAAALAISAAGSANDLLRSSGAGAPTWTAPAALTRVDDTNVTLTLGGSPSTALVTATSLTLGWTGTLAGARGGTGYASIKLAGIPYGLTTSYIDGTGTAGTNNTAQTVKTIAIPANTLTQVGDRIHIRVVYRPDTGSAVTATATVNGVTVSSLPGGTGTNMLVMDLWLSYIDSTHANTSAVAATGNLSLMATDATSNNNAAGFDWTASQDVDIDQNAVVDNRITVYEIVGTIYPKAAALA